MWLALSLGCYTPIRLGHIYLDYSKRVVWALGLIVNYRLSLHTKVLYKGDTYIHTIVDKTILPLSK